MMMPAGVHEIVPVAVERALDSLAGGLFLCAAAWAWLRVARRQNSASRFFILFILLVGIAVLPFLGFSWLNVAAPVVASAHALVTLPVRFAEYLFIAWATIASALLARIAAGYLQLRSLKQNCTPIDNTALDSRTVKTLCDSSRHVELCTSNQINVPTALGLAGPAKIAIPAWLLDQLSPVELHHLVLHELAHLRRWDDWTNLAQRVLGAALFFHPAVWWLQARLSLEREMACDECVLAETGNARAYARSLANMAERSFVRRTVALAQAAVSRMHDTTLRVAKILSPAAQHPASKLRFAGSAAAFAGISLVVALYSPDLVGFTVTQPAAPIASAADIASPALKPIRASFRFSEAKQSRPAIAATKPKLAPRKRFERKPEAGSVMARAEQKPSLYVPAKSTQYNTVVAQPAMLVIFQETVSDNGSFVMVQQTYWHVIVYHPVQSKEHPAKTT